MVKVKKSSKKNKSNNKSFIEKFLLFKGNVLEKYSHIKNHFKNSQKYLIIKKSVTEKYCQIKKKVKNNKNYIKAKNYVKNSYSKTKEYIQISYKYINFRIVPKLLDQTEKLNNKIINEEGREFWSVLSTSQKWGSKIIWSLVGVTSFGMIYISFASIDETIQSTGKLEPKGTTIDVKVPMGGVIKKILVEEGELVKKNQNLLELDTTAAKSKLEALDRVKDQIIADTLLSKIQLGEKINIERLTDNQKIKLNSLKNEYDSRINASINSVDQIEFQKDSLLEKIKSQEEVLKIREEILVKLKEVTEIGGLSRIKFAKEKQEVIQLRGQLLSSEADFKRVNAQLSESENRLRNTIASSNIDFTTKIEENNKQVAQLQNQINETKLTLDYQEIKSPSAGLIFDLQPAAPGFVVNSKSPILKVVPIDDLVARIFVSNRDIAFLKKGQIVKIRLDAYPYNEFGELEGEIESIGSDVLEPDEKYEFFRFPITVKLQDEFLSHKGKNLPLITGMSLSANIVLRQRPVISIFTERLLPFWNSLEQI